MSTKKTDFFKTIKGAVHVKNNIANIITISRLWFSLCLLYVAPFSIGFWILYSICGLTDILDGWLARKLMLESHIGDILDSIADFVFFAVCMIIVFINVSIPKWLIICCAIIAIIKIGVGIVVYYTYRGSATMHTFANKVIGGLLFISPMLYIVLGELYTGILLVAIALLCGLYDLYVLLSKKY